MLTSKSIYEAALEENVEKLQIAISFHCIDEWQPGRPFFSIAAQLALEGQKKAAEFLITHGAHIDYVAAGAAQGGYRDYAESLLSRNADINEAAYGAALGGHRDYAEELIARGAKIDQVAYGASQGGHRDYVEDLCKRGANINQIAKGAALGGHQEDAEALIAQGANISEVAHSAAQGGFRNYAESLINQGADIDEVANGAAQGGHRDYAEALITQWDANIDYVAYGAAQGGHREHAEILIDQWGANINEVAHGAAQGGHRDYVEALIVRGVEINEVSDGTVNSGFSLDKENRQLSYFSYFSPAILPRLMQACTNASSCPIKMEEKTQKRTLAISHYMYEYQYTYKEALARTAPDCQGALFLLMLMIGTGQFPGHYNQIEGSPLPPSLPSELWFMIFNFIFPQPLQTDAIEHLGNRMEVTYLAAQLNCYQSMCNSHQEKARSFRSAALQAKSHQQLSCLVDQQVQLLKGNSQYSGNSEQRDEKYWKDISNSNVDKYYRIVGFWQKKLNNKEAEFDIPEEHIAKKTHLL